MACGLSNGHVTDDVTCCEAVRSASLATAWLLVIISIVKDYSKSNSAVSTVQC